MPQDTVPEEHQHRDEVPGEHAYRPVDCAPDDANARQAPEEMWMIHQL